MYRLSDDNIETMRKVEEITGSDFEIDEVRIPCDYLMTAIEALVEKVEEQEDVIKELEDELEESYNAISRNPYREIGMYESDF